VDRSYGARPLRGRFAAVLLEDPLSEALIRGPLPRVRHSLRVYLDGRAGSIARLEMAQRRAMSAAPSTNRQIAFTKPASKNGGFCFLAGSKNMNGVSQQCEEI